MGPGVYEQQRLRQFPISWCLFFSRQAVNMSVMMALKMALAKESTLHWDIISIVDYHCNTILILLSIVTCLK